MSSTIENWDSKNDCPKSSHPDYKAVMRKIHQMEEDVAFEIKLLERSGQKIVLLQDLKGRLVETPVEML